MTLVHLVRCPAETRGSFQGASSLGGFLQLAAQIPVCKQDLEGQAHRQDVQPRPLRPHPAMAPAKVYTVTATRLMPPTPGLPSCTPAQPSGWTHVGYHTWAAVPPQPRWYSAAWAQACGLFLPPARMHFPGGRDTLPGYCCSSVPQV